MTLIIHILCKFNCLVALKCILIVIVANAQCAEKSMKYYCLIIKFLAQLL